MAVEERGSAEGGGADGEGAAAEDEVGYPDMTLMPQITEHAINSNLQLRYDRDLIYTYTGSILVAVNPYKELDCYSHEHMQLYRGRCFDPTAPHVFALAEAAYSNLQSNERNQSVVISGESGAGKTETTKLILQYLCAAGASASWAEQQILEANTVLEAFGNARTVRNDNSSRFGKFVEVLVDRRGHIRGALLRDFLLERARITGQAPRETNYHVFYHLVTGAKHNPELQATLRLRDGVQFRYLQAGAAEGEGPASSEGPGGREGEGPGSLEALQLALTVLQVPPHMLEGLFKVLAAILWLGNLHFQDVDGERSALGGADEEAVAAAASLLGLPPPTARRVLLERQINVRGNVTDIPLRLHEARENRHAMARALYARTFAWLVRHVNSLTLEGECAGEGAGEGDVQGGFRRALGVLDIFGFENFASNSLEQLCINYANEKLHMFFNNYVFALEQEIYRQEGIAYKPVQFEDNQLCLELLERPPRSLLKLLSEQCHMPKGSDGAYLTNVQAEFGEHPSFEKGSRRTWEEQFAVRHYAGAVAYAVRGFVDKNRDTQQDAFIDHLSRSDNPFVRDLADYAHDQPPPHLDVSLHSPGNGVGGGTTQRGTSKGRPTVVDTFRAQLQSLVDLLQATDVWYVRCIKPNVEKAAGAYCGALVAEQLRYLGMLEIVRIRRDGYPVHVPRAAFLARYRCLLPAPAPAPAPAPRTAPPQHTDIISVVGGSAADWQAGRTRVFLRAPLHTALEARRARTLQSAALHIQTWWRGRVARRRWVRVRGACVRVQAAWRGWVERARFLRVRRAACTLQRHLRAAFAREVAAALREMRRVDTEMKLREERNSLAEKASEERAELASMAGQLRELAGRAGAAGAAGAAAADSLDLDNLFEFLADVRGAGAGSTAPGAPGTRGAPDGATHQPTIAEIGASMERLAGDLDQELKHVLESEENEMSEDHRQPDGAPSESIVPPPLPPPPPCLPPISPPTVPNLNPTGGQIYAQNDPHMQNSLANGLQISPPNPMQTSVNGMQSFNALQNSMTGSITNAMHSSISGSINNSMVNSVHSMSGSICNSMSNSVTNGTKESSLPSPPSSPGSGDEGLDSPGFPLPPLPSMLQEPMGPPPPIPKEGPTGEAGLERSAGPEPIYEAVVPHGRRTPVASPQLQANGFNNKEESKESHLTAAMRHQHNEAMRVQRDEAIRNHNESMKNHHDKENNQRVSETRNQHSPEIRNQHNAEIRNQHSPEIRNQHNAEIKNQHNVEMYNKHNEEIRNLNYVEMDNQHDIEFRNKRNVNIINQQDEEKKYENSVELRNKHNAEMRNQHNEAMRKQRDEALRNQQQLIENQQQLIENQQHEATLKQKEAIRIQEMKSFKNLQTEDTTSQQSEATRNQIAEAMRSQQIEAMRTQLSDASKNQQMDAMNNQHDENHVTRQNDSEKSTTPVPMDQCLSPPLSNGEAWSEREARRRTRVERRLHAMEQALPARGVASSGAAPAPGPAPAPATPSDPSAQILDFANAFFNDHPRSPDGTIMATLTRKSKSMEVLSKEEMVMYHKGNNIPTSHIQLHDPDSVTAAVNIFRDLCRYMRGEVTAEKETHIIQSIIGKGLEREELRDEIIIQCVRQITECPHAEWAERVWLVLCLCAVAWQPSRALHRAYTAWLRARTRPPPAAGAGGDTPRSAHTAQWCLDNCRGAAPRALPPSTVEIAAMRRLGTIVCRFFFLDGRTKAIDVHPADTAAAAGARLADKIGLAAHARAGWAVYQQRGAHDEHVRAHHYLYDVIASWEMQQSGGAGGGGSSDNRFVFKRRLFRGGRELPSCPVEVALLYAQAVHSVVKVDEFPVSEKVSLQLAGLQAQVQLGEPAGAGAGAGPAQPPRAGHAYAQPEAFLPARIARTRPNHQWATILAQAHRQYGAGRAELTAKALYLSCVMQYPLYGVTLFPVTYKGYWPHGSSVLLGVGCEGILLVRPGDKATLLEVRYGEVGALLLDPVDNELTVSLAHHAAHTTHRYIVLETAQKQEAAWLMASYCPALGAALAEEPPRRSVPAPERARLAAALRAARRALVDSGLLRRPTDLGAGSFLRNTLRRLSKNRVERGRGRGEGVGEREGETYKGFPPSYWGWARSLPHSLTLLNDTEEVAAMQIFKDIMSHAGLSVGSGGGGGGTCDTSSSTTSLASGGSGSGSNSGGEPDGEDRVALAQALLQRCMQKDSLLCELYMQLIKQTTEQPSGAVAGGGWARVCGRHWALLCACVGAALPPARALRRLLLAHLRHRAAHPAPTHHHQDAKFARAAEQVALSVAGVGRRALAPSREEIVCVGARRGLHVRALLPDGRQHALTFAPAATAHNLVTMLQDKIGLPEHATGYALYEVCASQSAANTGSTGNTGNNNNNSGAGNTGGGVGAGVGGERALAAAERVVDVLARWEKAGATAASCRLVLKKRLFVESGPLQASCAAELELLYHQLLHALRNDRLPIDTDEAVMVGALHAQVVCGDCAGGGEACGAGAGALQAALPPRLAAALPAPALRLHHLALRGTAPHTAMRRLLALASSWPLARAHVYDVMQSFTSMWPRALWLCVDGRGVSLCRVRSRAALVSHDYAQLVCVSPAPRALLLVTRAPTTPAKHSKLVLNTDQAYQIATLIKDYIEAVRGPVSPAVAPPADPCGAAQHQPAGAGAAS